MNLSDLKLIVDHAVEYISHFRPTEEVEVVLTLCDPIKEKAPRRSVGLLDAELGIDIEAGEFRLEPNLPIVINRHTYDDILPPLISYSTDGKRNVACRRCERRVDGDKHFWCPYCGQKFRTK